MKQVSIRFSFFGYVPFLIFLFVALLALYVDINTLSSTGHFKRDLKTFTIFLVIATVFMTIVTKVLPSYKVVLSELGILRRYTVRLFGFTFYQDKYGKARWEDVESLDTFNIGWLWGLALFFRVDGRQRMIMLNLLYSNNKDAVRMILDHIPTHKISKDAMKKIRKWGIEVDRK